MFSKKMQKDDTDRKMTEDIMHAQQNLADGYNKDACNTENMILHEDMLNILREEHDIFQKLREETLKRGWQTTETAEQTDVSYAKTRFFELKQSL